MKQSKKLNFDAINGAALGRFESLLRQWLPGGKKSGAEYSVLNPMRNDSHAGSFSINIHKGVWQDFATGDGGGDPVSLFSYLFHNNDQGAAAKELAELLGVGNASIPQVQEKPKKPTSDWRPIVPPVDAPAPHKAHIKRGLPEQVWCYRSATGQELGYIYRFRNSSGGKEVLPLSWCRNEQTGAEEWRWMAFAEPRWLYGLEKLSAIPDKTVLLVEGEKCVDAVDAQLPELVGVTWPGGSKAVDKADWSPLAGRKVIIWPDCDAQTDKSGTLLPADKQPGMAAALKIADKLLAMGCKVWLLEIPEPGEKTGGWDIADAVSDGLNGDDLAAFIRGHIRFLAPAELGDNAVHSDNAPRPASAEHYGNMGLEEWQLGLIEKGRGGLEDCRENVFLILSRHPDWVGVIGFNEFTYRVEKRKTTPFGSPPGEWKTSDDYEVGLWMVRHCKLLIHSESSIVAGVAMVAEKNKFHPPREWLESLPAWDGVNRLDHYLVDCVGCDNSVYMQMIGRFFMIGLIARLYRPGCAMQYMPVLEGNQGIGKSTLWRVLGGEWFQESPFKLGDKDAFMQINGALIYEIAEMDSFNKAESTLVKAFITQQNDRYREPYARRPVDRPRQCVFVGTTNHGEYLKDTTGNRRFWPIKARHINIELMEQLRPLLFAEALHRFNAGERWHPTREEENAYFVPEQDSRRIVDPWLYPLQDWLDDTDQRFINEFTTADILCGCFKVEISKIDGNRGMAMRIGNLIAEIDGWERKRRASGRREWVYVRPNKARVSRSVESY